MKRFLLAAAAALFAVSILPVPSQARHDFSPSLTAPAGKVVHHVKHRRHAHVMRVKGVSPRGARAALSAETCAKKGLGFIRGHAGKGRACIAKPYEARAQGLLNAIEASGHPVVALGAHRCGHSVLGAATRHCGKGAMDINQGGRNRLIKGTGLPANLSAIAANFGYLNAAVWERHPDRGHLEPIETSLTPKYATAELKVYMTANNLRPLDYRVHRAATRQVREARMRARYRIVTRVVIQLPVADRFRPL